MLKDTYTYRYSNSTWFILSLKRIISFICICKDKCIGVDCLRAKFINKSIRFWARTFLTFCQRNSEMKVLGTLNCLRTTWISSWPMSPTSPPLLVWPGQHLPTVCWTRCLWSKTWIWTRSCQFLFVYEEWLTLSSV